MQYVGVATCSSLHVQVVRCFEDEDVHHVNGKVDPAEDAETINFELALADVTQIEKRLERLKKGRAKTKEEQASNEVSGLDLHSMAWSACSCTSSPAQLLVRYWPTDLNCGLLVRSVWLSCVMHVHPARV